MVRAGHCIDVAEVLRFEMPMEAGLELMSSVSPRAHTAE